MFRLFTLTVALALSTSSFCEETGAAHGISDQDRAIVAIVLQDFVRWDDATFGRLKGVLAIKQRTISRRDETVEGIRALAPNIRSKISDSIARAHLSRNTISVNTAEVVRDSAWVKLMPENQQNAFPFTLPPNVKAEGSFTLPGIGNNGTRAIIQIHHSWSIHGAIVTYVLSKKNGTWQVIARDQAVFL